MIPDACTVLVNFRFAPDRTEAHALDQVREALSPYDVTLAQAYLG